MTELQIGLAVIGALAVVAVVAYNRWQERGARRDAERAFGSGHADVLLPGERREPTLEARRPAPPPGAAPAERVDYVIELSLARPAAPTLVHEAWAPVERRFARRVLLAVEERRVGRVSLARCRASVGGASGGGTIYRAGAVPRHRHRGPGLAPR